GLPASRRSRSGPGCRSTSPAPNSGHCPARLRSTPGAIELEVRFERVVGDDLPGREHGAQLIVGGLAQRLTRGAPCFRRREPTARRPPALAIELLLELRLDRTQSLRLRRAEAEPKRELVGHVRLTLLPVTLRRLATAVGPFELIEHRRLVGGVVGALARVERTGLARSRGRAGR